MKILIVDDDQLVLRSVVLRVKRGFPAALIVACGDPLDAVGKLEEEVFDLVVADFSMPQMSGLTFLSMVADKCPGAVRVLHTSCTPRLLKGRQEYGLVHKHITKPAPRGSWFIEQLQEALMSTRQVEIEQMGVLHEVWGGSEKGYVPVYWLEDGKIVYAPQTEWERKTLIANKFKLEDASQGTYSMQDGESGMARAIARNISQGGLG